MPINLKRHALIERARGTRARPNFYCSANSESEKSPRVVYGLNDKTVWVFFLKICPANNINSALNFVTRVANQVMLNGSVNVFKCSYFGFHK